MELCSLWGRFTATSTLPALEQSQPQRLMLQPRIVMTTHMEDFFRRIPIKRRDADNLRRLARESLITTSTQAQTTPSFIISNSTLYSNKEVFLTESRTSSSNMSSARVTEPYMIDPTISGNVPDELALELRRKRMAAMKRMAAQRASPIVSPNATSSSEHDAARQVRAAALVSPRVPPCPLILPRLCALA